MKTAVVAIFAVAVVMGVQAQSCGKGEVCPDNTCCMYSGGRYTTPSCQPKVVAGGTCRPNNQPQDIWLQTNPNDPATLFTDVYSAVCPCQDGLTCSIDDNGICI